MKDQHFEYAANISIMFTEVDLLDRPAAARAAGFDKIESWWPFPGPTPAPSEVDAFVAAIKAAGTSLIGQNFYAGNMPGGERGIGTDPDRAEEFASSFPILTEIAQRTGCRNFNLLYGQLADDRPAELQHASAADALAAGARAVEPLGGTVLLEPLAKGLNGAYPLLLLEDALEVIDGPLAERGVDNVRPLFDLFHLGSNGADLLQTATRYAPRVGHVQVADSPGRGEPGTGQLPITATLDTLYTAGYQGVVACEYKPTKETINTLDWIG